MTMTVVTAGRLAVYNLNNRLVHTKDQSALEAHLKIKWTIEHQKRGNWFLYESQKCSKLLFNILILSSVF